MPRGFPLLVLILLAVAAVTLGALALTHQERMIRTEVLIDATPEDVWLVLSNIGEYPQWNPFIVRLEGALAVGKELEVTLSPPGGTQMSFDTRVVTVTKNRELAWRAGLVVPGIFLGAHRFLIEPAGDGRTKLVHSERFTGLLIGPLTHHMLDRFELGFVEMNQAVKIKAEMRR